MWRSRQVLNAAVIAVVAAMALSCSSTSEPSESSAVNDGGNSPASQPSVGADSNEPSSAGSADGPVDSAFLKQLKDAGKATMGVVNQPPISGVDAKGNLIGFSPVLAEKIFNELGVPKVSAVVGQYGDMIPGLQAGRWDMSAAALLITPERCEQVVYTEPILVDYLRFASKGPVDLTSLTEVADQGVDMGILTGSAYIATAKAAGVTDDHIKQYNDIRAGLDAVLAGRVKVMVGSASGYNIDGISSDITLSDAVKGVPVSVSGFTFTKDHADLRDAFNVELEKLAKDGTYAATLKAAGMTDPTEWAFTEDGEARYTMAAACGGTLPTN